MGKSMESAIMQDLLSGTKAAMHVANGDVAIRLKYKGSGTVTTVVVDTNQDITLTSSDGGTEEFLFADFITMGSLVDAISGSNYWEAKLLDALRADLTAGNPMVDDAGLTITADGYYDCLIDTNVALSLTYRCTYDRNVGAEVPGGNHRVALKEFTYWATLGNASVNDVQVWEYDRQNNTENQIFQALSVTDNTETSNFAGGHGELSAGFNNDIIVRIVDDTSLADAGAYLQVRYIRE